MTVPKKSSLKEYDLIQQLGISPKKSLTSLVVSLGEKVKKGDLLAQSQNFFKKKFFLSPIDGILDSLTEKGILRIKISEEKPTRFSCPPAGKNTELKGDWGVGDRVLGDLCCFDGEVALFDFQDEHSEQILAFSGKINRGLWHKAKVLGAKGIICSGLADDDFRKDIEKEVLFVNGQEKRISLPLIIFNQKNFSETWEVLKKNCGKKIFLDGEGKRILIPLKNEEV